MIVKPNLWGRTVRIRLSNAFGTGPVTFSAAAIGLQEYQANVVHGSTVGVSLNNGRPSMTVPTGGSALSDAVTLPFYDQIGRSGLSGCDLAVSFAVRGASGPASYHADAFITGYISPPGSGDVTANEDDTAFPYSTTSFFFLSELDVVAPLNTLVVVAFGDSITDGTFSTLNGNDRRSNVMSRQLHENSVIASASSMKRSPETRSLEPCRYRSGGMAREDRRSRWLGTTVDPVIAGYKAVVSRLHARGVAVIGADGHLQLCARQRPGGEQPTCRTIPRRLRRVTPVPRSNDIVNSSTRLSSGATFSTAPRISRPPQSTWGRVKRL